MPAGDCVYARGFLNTKLSCFCALPCRFYPAWAFNVFCSLHTTDLPYSKLKQNALQADFIWGISLLCPEVPWIKERAILQHRYTRSICKLSQCCLQVHDRLAEFCDALSMPQSGHVCFATSTFACVPLCLRDAQDSTAESCPPWKKPAAMLVLGVYPQSAWFLPQGGMIEQIAVMRILYTSG